MLEHHLHLGVLHFWRPPCELVDGGPAQEVFKTAATGTATPLNTQVPLSLSLRLSTAAQSFQSMTYSPSVIALDRKLPVLPPVAVRHRQSGSHLRSLGRSCRRP